MHSLQRQQTTALLQSKGIDCALFTRFESVKWLTGFHQPVQLGLPHHFAGGPAAVWYAGGHYTLIVLDAFGAVADEDDSLSVVTVDGYTIERPITGGANLEAVFSRVLQATGTAGKVGVEFETTPALLYRLLDSVSVVAIDDWLVPLRMIKTEEELVKLRHNFALTDMGHIAARQAIQAGLREIDVWTAIQAAINREAGERVPLGNDCVVSSRAGDNIGGFPAAHVINAGDSLTVDLSTVRYGYWSDSSMTYYTQERTPQQNQAHRTIQEALEYAISLVRPGVVAKDLDAKVRDFIARAGYAVYPHHTGHSVGVSPHEAPRIVPYNDQVLQAGMVIMLEPGVYIPGEISVRIEDAVLVTADGAEVLTTHDKS